ncbi:MAG: FliI/YscN family ATPase [bacterium]
MVVNRSQSRLLSDGSGRSLDLSQFERTLEVEPIFACEGRVVRLAGIGLEAVLPSPVQGQIVEIDRMNHSPLTCEIIGFDSGKVFLMPLGELEGVRPGAPVKIISGGLRVNTGDFLIGRVVDGLGRPIDGKGELPRGQKTPIDRHGPNPVTRPLIDEPMFTGIRAIDTLLTIGKGQRVGIFSGSGVGKSIILGMIARYTRADVNVIALIGERGREVREFIERDLGEEGLKRSVVIVATSNEPALVRLRGALTATAIAEYFRDSGSDVLFMMDSLTRFALAGREVGLASGEPPATRGYPPSVFGLIPKLLERAGRSPEGSITGLYSVLVEGDDLAEPVSDIARATLDGHFVLSRDLADQGHYPAIDILSSISRVMRRVISGEQNDLAQCLREHLASFKEMEDLINIGAYQRGTNPRTDEAIDRIDAIRKFLRQDMDESSDFEDALEKLRIVAGSKVPQKKPTGAIEPPPSRMKSQTAVADAHNPKAGKLPPGAYET